MRRVNVLLVVIMMVSCLSYMPTESVKAAEQSKCVDGSYLTEDDYSEGEAVNLTRGIYSNFPHQSGVLYLENSIF